MILIKKNISELDEIVSIKDLVTFDEYNNFKNIVDNFVKVDDFMNYINIQIVVESLSSANHKLTKSSIVDIINKEHLCILKLIYHKKVYELQNKAVFVTLIEDKSYDNFRHTLFNKILNIGSIIDAGKINKKTLENKMEKMFEDDKNIEDYFRGRKRIKFKSLFRNINLNKSQIKIENSSKKLGDK